MLPKGNELIALFLLKNPEIRHRAKRRSEILRCAQDDSEGLSRNSTDNSCRWNELKIQGSGGDVRNASVPCYEIPRYTFESMAAESYPSPTLI